MSEKLHVGEYKLRCLDLLASLKVILARPEAPAFVKASREAAVARGEDPDAVVGPATEEEEAAEEEDDRVQQLAIRSRRSRGVVVNPRYVQEEVLEVEEEEEEAEVEEKEDEEEEKAEEEEEVGEHLEELPVGGRFTYRWTTDPEQWFEATVEGARDGHHFYKVKFDDGYKCTTTLKSNFARALAMP